MKLLMMIVPTTRTEDLQALIARHEVHAFSEIDDVLGEGETGKHLDTRVWPGSSRLLFTVVPDNKADELFDAIRDYKATLYPGEGIKAFVLPVEKML